MAIEKEGPVDPQYVQQINAVGRAIDEFLNPDGVKKTGFMVLMFATGEAKEGDRMNYLSNVVRADMIAAMKEFIARNEGTYQGIDPTRKQ